MDDLAKFRQTYVVKKLAENFATQCVLLIVIAGPSRRGASQVSYQEARGF